MATVVFAGALVVAGLGGFALLARLGLEAGEAWAAGRVVGLAAAVLPAWWAGTVGLAAWPAVASVLLLIGSVAGVVELWRRRQQWREMVLAEGVFLAVAVLVLLVRLDRPEILHTEKPMDFAILNVLIRADSFPPPDMWLAGGALPYYYWGALVWAVPLRLSGMAPEVGYNLLVGLVAGSSAAVIWMLARGLGGGHRSGLVATAFALLLGTPDGLRQLLAAGRLGGVDLWASSRQVANTITEYPLFTLWLGDLHPHLLSVPLAAAAMLVAWRAGRREPTMGQVILVGVLVGCVWAANPWAAPPTWAACALLLLTAGRARPWPPHTSRRRWFSALALPLVGLAATLPFHLRFDAPFQGLGLSRQATPPVQLALYGGALLLPCVWVALREAAARTRHARSLRLPLAAAVVLAAAASGRPTLVLLASCMACLGWAAMDPGDMPDRGSLALAALALFLLAVPEVVFVRDLYGEQLQRMNTVFKSYIQAWMLLAVTLPVMIRRATSSRPARALLLVVLLAVSAPHAVRAAVGVSGDRPGLDGLRWMDADDRALVEALRREAPGTTLVEAVGEAYSEYGRLSAASGVPALLGWANHEVVWRGSEVREELQRRRMRVDEIYSCGDPRTVRRLVREAGVDLVAVGSLERRDFEPESLAAVAAAGQPQRLGADALLVRFERGTARGPGGEP